MTKNVDFDRMAGDVGAGNFNRMAGDVGAGINKGVKGLMTLFAGIVVFFIAIWILSDIIVVVPPGYVGVDYTAWSGVRMDKTRPPGWSLKWPIVQTVYMVKTARDTINLYPNGDDIAVSAPTKEGLIVTSDVSVLYRTKAENAPKIIQELTENYRYGTLIPEVRSVTREVTGGMSVTEIYGPGREKIQREVYEKLIPLFEKDGFVLEQVLMREITMPAQIAQAIEDKQSMEQAALKKQYEVELAQKEAERKKIEGEGIANNKIAIAKGDAESLKLVAQAIKENPEVLKFKNLEVLQDLYKNPNTKFVALPSNQMIMALPEDFTT
jgi:regulator of protease activity HflC (stomatin/prohibitin superfamily)